MTDPILHGATIAFDLDGTLVDTAPDLIGALNVVLVQEGLAPVPLAASRRLIGGGALRLVERGFAQAGRPVDPAQTLAMTDRLVEVYLDRISQESAPYEGMEAALDVLAEGGATLVVCTNKREGLSRTLLEALGLTGRFAAIVGADSVPDCKPDPGHLRAAIGLGGGDMGRALLVGDTETDLKTGRAAGVPVVGVSFGYSETAVEDLGFDRLIHAFAELPAAAAALLRTV